MSSLPAPSELRPMLLTDTDRFPDRLTDWSVDVKWNGMRTLIHTHDGGMPGLWSRKGIEWSDRFPEFSTCVDLPPDSVFDAELIVTGEDSANDLDQLMRRLRMRKLWKIQDAMNSAPANLMIFDVLRYSGEDTYALPYYRRRLVLDSMPALKSPRVHIPPNYLGTSAQFVWDWTESQGLEGIVFKHRASPYLPDIRSDQWRRMKH
jgi:bifunctional non-homologous end joining protein LigD